QFGMHPIICLNKRLSIVMKRKQPAFNKTSITQNAMLNENSGAKNNLKIQALKKALAYAEAIVTTIPTPLIILYPGFKIRTANKAFYKTFKVSPIETENKMIYSLGNGQWNIPLLKRLLEEILPKKNVLADFEVDHFFENIGRKIMLLNARKLNIHGKNDPMILLSIEDITEKRSIESAVEKERKIILEHIPSGLMTLDKKWRFTYCNKKSESVIKRKLKDIKGETIWKILPEWSGSSFIKSCRKAVRTGKHCSFEQFFPNLNSWFNIQIFPSADGLSIYFDDITRHKKGEEIVEFERQKIFNLFMNAPALICVLQGTKHIFELANKPFMQMVGLKRSLIGTPIQQAIPELKDQDIFEILDEVFKTGQPFIGREMPVRINTTENGRTETILDFVFQPYNNSNGKVEGIILYASDITSLVSKRNRIEELSRQKDEFIGVASHELKTPVTSIKGYTQILQMRFAREGNANAVELLSRMDGQINKLSKLIADLLDATKIEGGKLQYHEIFFDFNKLVMEIVEEMEQVSQRHTIIIKLALTTQVYGDRDRIGQVITNFLSNAIKYSPNSAKIILTTTREKNSISLFVQDFGIGIPTQKQQKVFERFYRVSGNKEDTFPGMGLGLFISSEIIKRHKGAVSVKSTVNEGSTFGFTLPAKKRESNYKIMRKIRKNE
ncbi:MAG: ATP-binding protein, partial [Ginsengibacter sp.]